MTTVHDKLHASVFGSHTHTCKCGSVIRCSDPNDCQDYGHLCYDCDGANQQFEFADDEFEAMGIHIPPSMRTGARR